MFAEKHGSNMDLNTLGESLIEDCTSNVNNAKPKCVNGGTFFIIFYFMNFDEYIGTIMLCANAITPENWLDCDGRIMPIQSNELIFTLLRNRYGGDGTTNFALPKIPNLGDARYIICVMGNYPER